MKRFLLLLLVVALCLASCRKQVPGYVYPDFDPEPTMNAVLINGEPIQVYLTMAQRLDSVHPGCYFTGMGSLWSNWPIVAMDATKAPPWQKPCMNTAARW